MLDWLILEICIQIRKKPITPIHVIFIYIYIYKQVKSIRVILSSRSRKANLISEILKILQINSMKNIDLFIFILYISTNCVSNYNNLSCLNIKIIILESHFN
jgi:hypothetical protein